MAEAQWYVAHTYSGYENKVKVNLEKTIANRHLEDEILEVRVPLQDVVEVKDGVRKTSQKKMFPGYVLVKMVMNDDTWYVVRNTRGVTGFVGPGSKPVPLTEAEMKPLGIRMENVSVDFKEGDTIAVVAGVWKDTVGVVTRMDYNKQTATINVELFGRETPVEISFAEVRAMN
ncbi:transcription antitermination protein nusG [Lachnospiraceae bacterium YSD2013]|jgi:transcriptional antiterminator NusG|nr:transcription termination/antitermination factor NusG [Lachnospiraceae bacterium]SCX19043.1 transcription antitermination protein nusG [Lachnospiraceae bacterium YSD2013]MBO4679509.1 transcription termination/antitermination factor NusG [Lachnospiraceae bacterium]MBO4825060.1 transcription termination/antitermination factor NusG [Lachnospiraceae bacterium]MBP5659721.1 transcription termination/antitermination factor NusG [Lachnospiraceae bacterium]